MTDKRRLPDKEEKARLLVFNKVKTLIDPSTIFTLDEVKLVWFSKTLHNWKALVITTLPDQLYYEVTYNGMKEETYIDTYQKIDNNRISDEEYYDTFYSDGLQR